MRAVGTIAFVFFALLGVGATAGVAQPKPQPAPPAPEAPKEKEPPAEAGKPGRPESETDKRIKAALTWLADHQSKDGSWSGKDFSADSTRTDAKKTYNLQWVMPGKPEGDTGNVENMNVCMTGLAMLAFTGAGYDHKDSTYKVVMRNAVMYLRKWQRSSGLFGEEDKCSMVHDHAVATTAMCEVYGLSGDVILKPMAEKAVEWILNAQNPGKGWRYGIKPGESDTRMTGWCVLALKSAKMADIAFDSKAAYDGANAWLDSVTKEAKGQPPRVGYTKAGDTVPRDEKTKAWASHPEMEAISIISRLFTKKWDLENKTLKAQAELLIKDPPKWEDKKADFAYWYLAALALFQVGGTAWDKWEPAFSEALLKNQRGWRVEDKDSTKETLDEYGSWDAIDPAYPQGGRVWSTAINALSLDIYGRYQRLHK